MRIVDKVEIFDMVLEAGGIMFYVSSTEREQIDYIEKAFNNISKEEEEKMISILKEMSLIKKPWECEKRWLITVDGKEFALCYDAYQITVIA